MEEHLNPELGRAIRARRGRESQTALAGRLDLSQSTISNLESGRLGGISEEKLLELVDLLGIDRALIKTGIRKPPSLRFCRSVSCVSHRYVLDGKALCIIPGFLETAEARCRWCGGELVTVCPHCPDHAITPVQRGLHCPSCGNAYLCLVNPPKDLPTTPEGLQEYCDQHNRRQEEFSRWMEPIVR